MQLAEIIRYIEAKETILGTPEVFITELAIDSRKVTTPEHTLFFAIETEKNDGHLYIPNLYQMGVRNFVIIKVMESYATCLNANFLFVEDSVEALQRLAQKHRQQFHYPVIGITGSNGKTIVKEWLTSILDDKFKVVKSPDSYNSRLGVPLSVWQMSDQHDIAVFEAGISRPNEMRVLADIIDPTIGILTNIGAAHAQFFPSNNRKIIVQNLLCAVKLNLREAADILILVLQQIADRLGDHVQTVIGLDAVVRELLDRRNVVFRVHLRDVIKHIITLFLRGSLDAVVHVRAERIVEVRNDNADLRLFRCLFARRAADDRYECDANQ